LELVGGMSTGAGGGASNRRRGVGSRPVAGGGLSNGPGGGAVDRPGGAVCPLVQAVVFFERDQEEVFSTGPGGGLSTGPGGGLSTGGRLPLHVQCPHRGPRFVEELEKTKKKKRALHAPG